MFNLTKKPINHYEQHKVIAAIAGSIDELERYEASEDALGSCLMTTLKLMGYSEEQSLTKALLTVKALENDFAKMYWQERTFSHKVAVFVAIVETARNSINNGTVDKRTEALIKMALEDVKKDNGSNPVSNK